MSIYLAVPLVILAIPTAAAVLAAWLMTPSDVFLLPGLALGLVAGIAAAASALAYGGHVPLWVQIVGIAAGVLVALSLPGIGAGMD